MTREELEWSASSPLTRREGCGMCPYCGHSQNKGHDPECAFLDPDRTLESIQKEIEECARRALSETAAFLRFINES